MNYAPYADITYYNDDYGGTQIPADELEAMLKLASRHVDALTFNRIQGMGVDKLTPYQLAIIKEVVCMQADFEHENADEIGSILSSYSINGVSAQFGVGWNVHTENGVAMRSDVYALLSQTGLCCRLAR